METTEHRINAGDLQPGDGIVLARNRFGTPTKLLPVKSYERGESCNGLHINVQRAGRGNVVVSCDGCYDRVALIDVVRMSG